MHSLVNMQTMLAVNCGEQVNVTVNADDIADNISIEGNSSW